MRLHYTLELRADVVLPSPGGRGTQGGGTCLDFVPGATLLGNLGRDYLAVPEALRWDLFHSGAVRFGDARILDAYGVPTVPVPLVMEQKKGSKSESLDGWSRAWEAPDDTQMTGVTGHLGSDGKTVKVQHRRVLRTAVSFLTGRANDGQLFEMQALAAGQRLGGSIAIDLEGEAAAQIADLLRTRLAGHVVLGRRKGAGQGEAWLSFHEARPAPQRATCDTLDASGRLYLWLHSEVSLVDPETGAPTTVARPAHFGLPEGAALDPDRCVVRSCRWVPFNGHRRRPDVAHLALKAGSVLAFTGVPAEAIPALRARLARGVGQYRAEGLGEICVQPLALAGELSLAAPAAAAKEAKAPPLPAADSPLRAWLKQQADHATHREAARAAAAAGLKDLERYTRNRRKYPGPSQWSQVAGLARAYLNDPEKLKDALFHEVERQGTRPLRDEDARDQPGRGDARERAYAAPKAGARHENGALRRGAAGRLWFPGARGPGDDLEKWLAGVEPKLQPLALGLLAQQMAKALKTNRLKTGEA